MGNSQSVKEDVSTQKEKDVSKQEEEDVSKQEEEDVSKQEPWRDIGVEWNTTFRDKLKKEVKKHSYPSVDYSKILFVGPVNAGKSSVINTILSVFAGYPSQAAGAGTELLSVTNKYEEYKPKIHSADNFIAECRFYLCDTSGLHKNWLLERREFEKMLDGHLRHGYEFRGNAIINTEDSNYQTAPQLKDRHHCVCFVLDCSTFEVLDIRMEVKKLLQTVRMKGIPYLVLLSKIDLFSTDVANDLQNAYKCQKIKSLVNNVAGILGIPAMNIELIKCYDKETEISYGIDILALHAVRQMLHRCSDYLDKMVDKK